MNKPEVIVLSDEYMADELDRIEAKYPGIREAYDDEEQCNCCLGLTFGWDRDVDQYRDLRWMSGDA